MRRCGVLSIYAVHFIVNGWGMALDDGLYSSLSYYWIFYLIPRAAWSFIFVVVGTFALFAAMRGNTSRLVPHAFAAVALVALWWAVGFVAAGFTGHLIAGSAAVSWSLVASLAIYAAGASKDEDG